MSNYNDANDVYNNYIARQLELYKKILNGWPQKCDHSVLEPPNYIESLSDEDREAKIREDYAGDSEEDYSEGFLLRKLDEARAEIERLKTLIPAQPKPIQTLSGPFWKQSEE